MSLGNATYDIKSPLKVDGYVELKNMSSTPSAGDSSKLFVKEDDLYLLSPTGTEKKMGIDDETLNKINDLSQNGVGGDVTNNYIINEMSNPLTMNPLEYGFFRSTVFNGVNITPILIDGNMSVNNNKIPLKKGICYNISFTISDVTLTSSNGRVDFQFVYDKESVKEVIYETKMLEVTDSRKLFTSNSSDFIYTPLEDIEVYAGFSTYTYSGGKVEILIQEIRNNPVNQYGGFETEILFDGIASTISSYELSDLINNYNLLCIIYRSNESDYGKSMILPVSAINKGISNDIELTGHGDGYTLISFTDDALNIDYINTTYVNVTNVIGIKGQIPSLLIGGEF